MATTTTIPLNIEIRYGNVRLTQKQEDYVREKLDNLQKYSDRIGDESTRCKVEFQQKKLKSAGDCVKCEVTFFIPQAIIRAEVAAQKIEEAVDLAINKLKRQVARYKSRWNNWSKKGVRSPDMTAPGPVLHDVEVSESDEFGALPMISKRKQYSKIVPMTEPEAIERMELIGHDFFLFLNKESNRFSVVYRREDGTYGIIEPKVETGE